MRIDLELVNRQLFQSRQKAKEAVTEGKVFVNGKVCPKPSADVSEDDEIKIADDVLGFVGRGGLKLEKIASKHHLDFKGKTCMDIGASTGGFTDCMLQRGAEYVYAVDVGSGQLAAKLCEDSRVCNMEKTDIRNVSKESLERVIDFISVDVSFISLTLIIPKAYELLDNGGSMAVLVKPQFEAGKSNIGKNGIVKSPKVHEKVLAEVIGFAFRTGFEVTDADYSPVTGGSGNIEYLLLMKKGNAPFTGDIKKLVGEAFKNFKNGGKA
ncbi:MAG: TlyA family RNA methyltransferase [Oscillospiraceae bacterium]|nr:TlyA family RNA methyltransferase [Oscillospiraceae bacterium]